MPMNLLFWVIYLLAFLIGFWGHYGTDGWPRRAGGWGVLWLLVGILGWRVFGAAIR